LAELEKINTRLAELIKDLNMIKEKCAVIEANINKAEVSLAEAKANFASIMSRRMNAEADVEKKAVAVDELRRRLAAAEQALADAEIKLTDILSDEKRLPAIIEGI
jgi:chromosome segregation ATPase